MRYADALLHKINQVEYAIVQSWQTRPAVTPDTIRYYEKTADDGSTPHAPRGSFVWPRMTIFSVCALFCYARQLGFHSAGDPAGYCRSASIRDTSSTCIRSQNADSFRRDWSEVEARINELQTMRRSLQTAQRRPLRQQLTAAFTVRSAGPRARGQQRQCRTVDFFVNAGFHTRAEGSSHVLEGNCSRYQRYQSGKLEITPFEASISPRSVVQVACRATVKSGKGRLSA